MVHGERFNAWSHLVGAFLALGGMAILVVPPALHGEWTKAAGFLVYGISLVSVYIASTLYHSFRGTTKKRFRQVDRIAIYLLIAGTYTPLVLVALKPTWGWGVLIVVWALALTGAVMEIVMAGKKAPVSIAMYIFMGWISLGIMKPLAEVIGVVPVALLLAGGVVYTLGAIALFYRLVPRHHEVWHVMVVLGSACHFTAMLFLIGVK